MKGLKSPLFKETIHIETFLGYFQNKQTVHNRKTFFINIIFRKRHYLYTAIIFHPSEEPLSGQPVNLKTQELKNSKKHEKAFIYRPRRNFSH